MARLGGQHGLDVLQPLVDLPEADAEGAARRPGGEVPGQERQRPLVSLQRLLEPAQAQQRLGT